MMREMKQRRIKERYRGRKGREWEGEDENAWMRGKERAIRENKREKDLRLEE